MNNERQLFDPGYLIFEDDIIISLGNGPIPEDLPYKWDQHINAHNMLVIPGLINAHTHLFQTFIRGLGDDLPLEEWLERYIWPVAANMTIEEAKLAATLGIIENIRSGVTAVIDNQYIHTNSEMDDVFCQVAVGLGIRFMLARGWTDRNYHPAFIEKIDEVMEQIGSLVSRWNDHKSGRLRVEFGPLSQTVVSSESISRAALHSKELGVGIHIHTSETKRETETCLRETGLRPVEWLDSLGALRQKTQLVHAVWLSQNEIELIAERGAKIVHCPVSNMYLASGVAPIQKMARQGISIALATDGPGSNNNQDMIETMKTTALMHKVSAMDARVFLPEEILWMACRGGAEAFGQPELIGSLEIGKKADIVLVDLNTPFAVPVHHPLSALVYNLKGSNVDTVIVDGKILMHQKKITVLDEMQLLKECNHAAASLMSRVKAN